MFLVVCESQETFADNFDWADFSSSLIIGKYKKPGTAQAGAARMAWNTHRMELILMLEKMYFAIFFSIFLWYKMWENITYAGIRTRYLSIRLILQKVIRKNF